MKKINGVIRAWCTYDLANSVYNLVINTAIFPIYYTAITSVNNEDKVDFFGFVCPTSIFAPFTPLLRATSIPHRKIGIASPCQQLVLKGGYFCIMLPVTVPNSGSNCCAQQPL